MVSSVVRFCVNLARILAMFLFFLVLPIFITILLSWGIYSFTKGYFYNAPWMMPSILALSAFIGGVVIRQQIDEERGGGLWFFCLGALAQIGFAAISWMDLTKFTIYSKFLPEVMEPAVLPVVYSLPCAGMLGLIFSRKFTLKPD